MNATLKKAIRDLSVSPKRTILVICALVLGIWGAGMVTVSYLVLSNDLNANYQSTYPLHAVFHSDDFDEINIQKLINCNDVEAVELRNFSLHRIEVYPNVWIPLWLYGVEDFERFQLAKVFNEEGGNIPTVGTILIERDGKRISDIRVGSVPRIRIGRQTITVPVSGICFDPAQAPATQDAFIYAYTDKQTYRQITGLPYDNRLIVRFADVYSIQDVEEKSAILIESLKKSGVEIYSTEIPRFNEHPHQWQLNTLLFLVGTIGLLAFLMGAMLTSQLVKSVLANQIRQIGILKAIGASRNQVFLIYVMMLLLIGFSASLIAIPLSVGSGYAFSHFAAVKLNFNVLTNLPHTVYLCMFLVSLLLPLILAFPILLKGTDVSVKSALNDYGISTTKSKSNFSFLKRLRLSDPMILALRNTQRNRKRLLTTITAMTLGVAIFNMGFNVRQSLWNLLSGYSNELKYDVQVALVNSVAPEEATSIFSEISNIQQLEMWVGGQIEGAIKLISTDNGTGIIAVPYNTKLLTPNVIRGRWLKPDDKFEVVLNEQAWVRYQKPEVGSSINLKVDGKTICATVSGIVKQYEKPRVYVDLAQYNHCFNPDGRINTIVFSAKDNGYDNILQLKKEIERSIAKSELNVSYVMSQSERVEIIYDHLNIILITIVMLSFVVLVVSAIGMASATGINILERTREIGVMRAIGATPQMIYNLFIFEGMITCLLSIFIGLLIAFPLSGLASAFFGKLMLGEEARLEYAFSPLGLGITLMVTLLFGWLASHIPAKSAMKVTTREALAYG